MAGGSDELVQRIDALDSRVQAALAQMSALQSDLVESAERIHELQGFVEHDYDTNLPNKRRFHERLHDEFEPSNGSPLPTHLAIGLLRLDDGYTRIRNTRDRGRVLLFMTAERLKKAVDGGPNESVFQSDRFDEFLVVLRGLETPEAVVSKAEEILEAIARPHAPPANDISFGAYIGLALFPDHGATREDLLRNAEIALDNAVYSQRRAVIYNETVGSAYREREEIEFELRQVSRTGFEHFSLVFQPFVGQDGSICGGESLIRWDHPGIGTVSPAHFIPLAEESGAIRFIGQWSLYQSCSRIRELPEEQRKGIYVSVNLSPQQFKQHDLVDRIAGILQSTGLDAEQLNLEVTETIVMDAPDEALAKMKDIKSLGIRLALDDFGTGYSSLAYLGQFEFDTLKIDRAFVDRVDESASAQNLLRAMLSMAKALGMKALAEGVERQEELDFLWSEGCDLVQGYYFSRPRPWVEFAAMLDKGFP